MENDPLFCHSSVDLTMEQQREITMKRVLRIMDYNFLPEEELIRDIRLVSLVIILGGVKISNWK